MRRHRATLLAVLATAAAGASGCGGDAPYAASSGDPLPLRLDEYRILPQRATVPAGRVRIVARNVGILTHNVAVVRLRRPAGDEGERVYARTPTAHPGQVVSTSVTLRPGTYRLACTIANHDNLGQYGVLRVEAPR